MNFLTLSLLFVFSALSWGKEKICPQVIIHGDNSIKFTDTEKQMMCGDSQVEAYKNIPSYQATFFLTGFLQSRGYLQPKFQLDGDVLHVDVGEKSRLKNIRVQGGEPKDTEMVKKEIHWKFGGMLITPSLLNQIEGEALRILREHGYPCAKVESSINATDSSIDIVLKRTKFFVFGEFEREKVDKLRDNALERFYPFNSNQGFNEKLLKLTEKRMLRTEVVQGTYFLDECSDDGNSYHLQQKFLSGTTKSIRFGAGASTEQGPMARVRWSNNRYKPMASQLTATVQASFRSQSLKLTADNYLWNHQPRHSLYTQAELVRETQYAYKQNLVSFKPHFKWTSDAHARAWTWTTGPTYESGHFSNDQRATTRAFSSVALQGNLQWMTHDYEFYDRNPEEGELLGFNFDYRHPSMGFPTQMFKLDTTWAKLAQLGFWGRGAIVGGARFNAGTNFVPANVPLENLPPSVKFYGGGSDDVRGFLLRTLPRNNGLGSLTKIGTKFELRRTYLWKESLEAFTFIDNAYFGTQSWKLQNRLWYSPGLGVRWLSPIGIVQTYVARALATAPARDYGNFYFLGLGGVF